ncbi:MAG TPA: hypothetical protein VGO16_17350 [Pseudonocardiaceae bacterium]|nr:hypothetical protein [Pseudonocardiaceae bacterium]
MRVGRRRQGPAQRAAAAARRCWAAVADYLRHARPQGAIDRCVFVRVKAPHRGLTPGGVTHAVIVAGRRAGLGPLATHRLRHTAAT